MFSLHFLLTTDVSQEETSITKRLLFSGERKSKKKNSKKRKNKKRKNDSIKDVSPPKVSKKNQERDTGSGLFTFMFNLSTYINWMPHPELQIKKNSCQTLGPASKRVLPDLLFFFRNFLIFHFQYSMIKGTILKP